MLEMNGNDDEVRGLENFGKDEGKEVEEVIGFPEEDSELENSVGLSGLENLLGDLISNRGLGESDLSFLNEEDDENDDENDYHNKSADLARKGKIREAADMSSRGLEKFPYNMDLLADAIKYSSDVGDVSTAEKYLNKLNERVPRNTWNWRAYTFVLDFLMKNFSKNEKLCREIIADYKKNLPYEEKSAVAESELEEKLGNHDTSKEILAKTVKGRFNAPQCALRLLDLQIQHGEFEEALRTSDYFLIASCEAQPSTNANYQLYVRCLAEDAVLHKKYYEDGSVTEEEVERMKNLYERILKIPELGIRFGSNIKDRMVMLDFMKISD